MEIKEEFQGIIDSGRAGFYKFTTMRVQLRETSERKKSGKVQTSYDILRVIDYNPNPQGELDFDRTS